jgi:murein DD-endopeptidase MepM/ murein hydrolase activator NlpD
MSGKAIAGIASLLVAILMSCVALAVVGAGGIAVAACTNAASTGAPGSPPPASSGGWPAVGRWNSQQLANAAVIVAVGQQLRVPPRGWVIAVAAAMQESSLTNLGDQGPRNDHDSLGLFQQRPSQGWGTPTQIMDPVYTSTQFYDRLLRVPRWQDLPLTDAAQAAQHSAAPDSYSKWETDAISVVAAVSGLAEAVLAACGAAGTWTQPVRGPIVSGFRTAGRPTHQGVDIGAPRGTIIRAASAGTVARARCNVEPAWWGCDRDGHPTLVGGCGWYVDINHSAGIITRYCHMATYPYVHEGHAVAAGEPLGIVGSSGNSSGPHLHFEIHLNGDHSSGGAVDPIPFMRQRDAPID